MQFGGLLEARDAGLYSPAADAWIDSRRPVERALITHAHGDHLGYSHTQAWCSASCAPLAAKRLGAKVKLNGIPYGEPFRLGEAWISFHPAGHILGSAQIRIEVDGQVAVVSGDYKRGQDGVSQPFEVVPCDVFVTETTFGLPCYVWPDPQQEGERLRAWWRSNQEQGACSVLLAYALGKAQRVLPLLEGVDGPILMHASADPFVQLYRDQGVKLPPTERATAERIKQGVAGAMVIAPPSVQNTPWLRKLRPCRLAMASGWMQVRGVRRRMGYDDGFILSDHVDWPELIQTVKDSGCSEVWSTHGFAQPVARYFRELGLKARVLGADETRVELE